MRRWLHIDSLLIGAFFAAFAAIGYPLWRHAGSALELAAGLLLALCWAALARALRRCRLLVLSGIGLVIGCGLRMAAAQLAVEVSPANDPSSYATLAKAVLNGRGLIAWGVRAHYPPLYPLLLAGFAWLTNSIPMAAFVTNVVADACSGLLLSRIARRVTGNRNAALAGVMCFLWPALIVDCGVAQKESLTLALALAGMLAAMRCFEGEGWKARAFCSACCGVRLACANRRSRPCRSSCASA